MAELSRIHWEALGASLPLSIRKPYTGRRLQLRAWAGEAWRSHLFPRVFIYRGWEGWEPQGEEPYEWSHIRYESCWKLDASWLGWAFELMPTYQGRLSYQNKLPVDYWIN